MKIWQGELEFKTGETFQAIITEDDGEIILEKKIDNEYVEINPFAIDIFSVLRQMMNLVSQ